MDVAFNHLEFSGDRMPMLDEMGALRSGPQNSLRFYLTIIRETEASACTPRRGGCLLLVERRARRRQNNSAQRIPRNTAKMGEVAQPLAKMGEVAQSS